MGEPPSGYRKLHDFAAYPASQYYILEKKIYHECLKDDGGFGYTYLIEKGTNCFARKHWR